MYRVIYIGQGNIFSRRKINNGWWIMILGDLDYMDMVSCLPTPPYNVTTYPFRQVIKPHVVLLGKENQITAEFI